MMMGVDVEAGVNVGVGEANLIEERGVSVDSGDAVATGSTNVTGVPPQAVKSKIVPRINVKNFFIKFLKWMMEIPKNAHAIEREQGCDDLNDIGLLRNDLCKTASGDHFHAGSEFFAKTFDHALHHTDISIQQTRLHGVDGVAPDNAWRSLQ